MGLSTKCWYGRHRDCHYYGCICDCHNYQSKMRKLLDDLEALNKAQRKEFSNSNPYPPK